MASVLVESTAQTHDNDDSIWSGPSCAKSILLSKYSDNAKSGKAFVRMYINDLGGVNI